MKLKSDKGLFGLFASDGRAIRLVGLVLLGIILIFIGGLGGKTAPDNTPTEEDRAAEMCAMMDGVGECRVMMTYHPDDDTRVYAVLVLCDGADSVTVRESVTSLFCSLYGIGANRVEVRRLVK